MAESNIIQMHDYAGNNQYPVTLASLVYDEDGETVSKKLALLLDWFEWGDEEETSVKTKYPFWSEKQLSAGGIGEEGGSGEGGIGTITGIKVNGEVWNEPDEFGVLTIPNYPTSLEWDSISGRPTHLSQFTDDVVAGKYLPLTGGTIEGRFTVQTEDMDGVTIYCTNTKYSMIHFYNNSGSGRADVGYIGVIENGQPVYLNSGGSEYPLIHSGNVGEYAPTLTGMGASGTWGINIRGSAVAVENRGRLASANLTGDKTQLRWFLASSSMTEGKPLNDSQVLHLPWDQDNYNAQLAIGHNGGEVFMQVRRQWQTVWSDWRTVAFTDSTVAGADALKDDAGNSIVYYGENVMLYIGDVIYANASTKILGKNIYLAYGASANNGLILNSYGNVTIGGSDLAGTDAKLYVRGITLITSSDGLYGVKIASEGNTIDAYTNYSETANLYINHNTNGNVYIVTGGGNVGIGTSNPTAKLQVAGNVNIVGYRLYWGESDYYSIGSESDNSSIPPHLAYRGYNGHWFYNSYGEVMRIDEYGRVGIGTTSPEYKLEVNGNGHFRSMLYMSDWLWFYSEGIYIHSSGIAWHDATGNNRYGLFGFDYDTITLYQNTVLDSAKSLTIGSAVLSWDYTNNALKIEGNVYTTGQLSAGGVGTEVQKVFDIAAATSTTEADASYTKTLTHNLNTYDLAVVVYEVEEITQSGVTTEKLTQVLADVTLTDENNVMVYFATRKINKKYRIVIIG